MGVAWTIRKGEADRQSDLKRIENERIEEERKKHIPYVKISTDSVLAPEIHAHIINGVNFENLEDRSRLHDNMYHSITICDFQIRNISTQNIIVQGIVFYGNYYPFSREEILEPQSFCRISTTKLHPISQYDVDTSIYLILRDILGYEYEIRCNVKVDSDPNIHTLITTSDGQEYVGFRSTYNVESVDLPRLVH